MRHRTGCTRSISHGDAEIGVLQRQDVIDAVTGHRDGRPTELQRVHHLLLLGRCHPTEYRMLGHNACQFLRTCRRVTSVDWIIGSRNACFIGNGTDRFGVVTRDDLDAHTLIEKVLDGGASVVTQLLIDDHDSRGGHGTRSSVGRDCTVATVRPGHNKDPRSSMGITRSNVDDLLVVGHYHVRCAENPHSVVVESDRGPLSGTRERHGGCHRPSGIWA